METVYPSEGDCKRVGPRLERIVDRIISFAHRKRFLEPLFDDIRTRIPVTPDLPEDWAQMVLAMVGVASVTTVLKRSQGFVRSMQNDLAAPDLQLARNWRRVPWVFIAFEETETAVHDIVILRPLGKAPPEWPRELPWDRLPVFFAFDSQRCNAGFSFWYRPPGVRCHGVSHLRCNPPLSLL